jgi:gamma-glutamyltranspeptidase/glutathione hydrolase
MHDFDPHPGMTNSVGPRKIPMSNMSPTIVLKEGKPILALGSAGGPRIVSSTLQVLLNVIEYGMELRDAVAAPRIHVNGTSVELEETVQRAVAMKLRKMGHSVEVRKRAGKADTGLYFGGVHAAQISDDNSLSGAPDPRRDGLAIGLS